MSFWLFDKLRTVLITRCVLSPQSPKSTSSWLLDADMREKTMRIYSGASNQLTLSLSSIFITTLLILSGLTRRLFSQNFTELWICFATYRDPWP
jgi:hypothetical protein